MNGELVIWHQGRLAFEHLQQRLGRTASSAARLAHQVPARYVAFDLLHCGVPEAADIVAVHPLRPR